MAAPPAKADAKAGVPAHACHAISVIDGRAHAVSLVWHGAGKPGQAGLPPRFRSR